MKYYIGICYVGLRKTTRLHRDDSQLGRDFKRELPGVQE
jgi:hypothetical protein